MSTSSGIILYDFLQVPGGAEQVSLQFARHFNADLCVGYVTPGLFCAHELSGLKITDLSCRSFTYPFTLLKTLHAFCHRTVLVKHYDWALYSGHYAPNAVFNNHSDRKILYCHTIPRFAYDLRAWYQAHTPWWQRHGLHLFTDIVRRRYEAAAAEMDTIIANSHNVANKIQKHLGKKAVVIYPPCNTKEFQWLGQSDYYLSLARLENYKRVELIIDAFKKMPAKKLLIMSNGSEYLRLHRRAANTHNIVFTGWVDRMYLRELIGHAIATIYIPIDEDFGLSPVESMAAGKPVIGVAEGGLLETVVSGQTGILLPPDPQTEHLIEAVHQLSLSQSKTMRADCEQRAEMFAQNIFYEKMQQVLCA